jgi:hypothetical protein
MSRYLLCVYDDEGYICVLDASGSRGNESSSYRHTTHVYLCVVMRSWQVGGTFVLQDLVPRRG